MRMKVEDDIKRWTAKRKSALVLDIIQGKTTVAQASHTYDLSPSEIEQWVDHVKRGMENALRANPQRMSENDTNASLRTSRKHTARRCWSCVPEKNCSPDRPGQEVIETIRQGLQADGITVSIAKLRRWFGEPPWGMN